MLCSLFLELLNLDKRFRTKYHFNFIYFVSSQYYYYLILYRWFSLIKPQLSKTLSFKLNSDGKDNKHYLIRNSVVFAMNEFDRFDASSVNLVGLCGSVMLYNDFSRIHVNHSVATIALKAEQKEIIYERTAFLQKEKADTTMITYLLTRTLVDFPL